MDVEPKIGGFYPQNGWFIIMGKAYEIGWCGGFCPYLLGWHPYVGSTSDPGCIRGTWRVLDPGCLPIASWWFSWRLHPISGAVDPTCMKDKWDTKHISIFASYRLLDNYTPQNKHGTWKWTLGKWDSYWKPSFPGSMLIFGGVTTKKTRIGDVIIPGSRPVGITSVKK